MACANCGCIVRKAARVRSCGDDGCCCRHLPVVDHGHDDRYGNEASMPPRPSWTTPAEALRVVAYRPHLRTTVRIALAVGTVLFVINQLDVVLRGDATPATWVKGVVTFLVPFTVSNLGILTATRTGDPPDSPPGHRAGESR